MKLFVCAIVAFCTLSELSKAEQPYTVKNEGFEHFNGLRETVFHLDGMKIVGRQRYVNGTWIFTEDMASDHYKFQLDLFSSPEGGDDQWKHLPMGVPRTLICEGVRDLYTKVLQPSLVEGENTNFPFVPEEGLCPIPKGEYFVKNVEANTDTWPNQIPRGLLKATLTFFKDEVSVGGGSLIMRIEDRK